MACVKSEAATPLGAEIWPYEKVKFGSVNISRVSSVVSRPKFTRFSSSNVVDIVVDRRYPLVNIFIPSGDIRDRI